MPSDQMKSTNQERLRSQNTNEILSDISSKDIENITSIDSVLDIEIQNTDLLIEQELENNIEDELDINEVGRSISLLPDFDELKEYAPPPFTEQSSSK